MWDIEAAHQKLVLRMKPRDVRLSIDASVEPMRLRASLRKANQRIDLMPRGIEINGVIQDAGVRHLGLVGIRIAIDTASGTASLDPGPRYGQGMLVSNEVRLERIRRGIEALQQLRKGLSSAR